MKPVWRVGVIGLVFAALMGVLVLQLWRLQVTQAAAYVQQVDKQQVRIVETPAPRGEIVDRDGRVLAGSRSALAVVADRKLISEEDEPALVERLAAFLGIPATAVQQQIDDGPEGSRITLATDLSDEQALFLVEHREEFPGVAIEPQPVRTYPEGPLAAHLLGYIGAPDAADLERGGVRSTDVLGKAGVEKQYDFLLRGTPGFIKYQVDARRDILGLIAEQPPEPGGTVITTIDAEIQAELETSLVQGLDLARRVYSPGCVPGPDDKGCPIRAVGVVLDPSNGAVIAMASVPGYDPAIFVDGLTSAEWESLQSGAVFNNFAIQGVYAPASAFKSVAYVAALEEGIFPEDVTEQSAGGVYDCPGRLEFQFTDGSPQVYRDWTEHGAVDLHEALQESCDVYFWQLALRVWGSDTIEESIIQDWARDLGFGSRTGIDLPFEQSGLIPDREWFNQVQAENPGRVREGSWVGGDLLNVVVGQGEVLSTPLQLANAYAAMLNGGTVWRPRVIDRVVDADGGVRFLNPADPLRTVEISPTTVASLKQDLQLVVNGSIGTARSAFEDFGDNRELVGGKTGTAEVIKGENPVDTAWFVGAAPISDPEYVVAVVIERGGSGGRVAAPTARRMFQYLLNGPEAVSPVVQGTDAD